MAYQIPLTVDQVVQFHGEITSYAGMRAVVTFPLQNPVVYDISINDGLESWKLRARAAGENDDGFAFLLPNDYNAVTNNVIWVRVG